MKMKLFKLKFVHPIGPRQFQLHILKSVLLQAIYVSIVIMIFYVTDLDVSNINTYYFAAILIILNVAATNVIFDFNKFRARFKDIYPDQNLTFRYWFFLAFFPVLFYGVIFFLCFQKSDYAIKPSRIFKLNFALPMVLGLLLFQSAFPNVAYWSSSASHYFIVDILHGAKKIIDYKEIAKFDDNALEKYKLQKSRNLNSTEVVLLVAVETVTLIKEKRKREIASTTGKRELELEMGLRLLHNTRNYLFTVENMQTRFLDFSFFHWMYPSGPTEILLLSLVDHGVTRKFTAVLYEKSNSILDSVEKKVDRYKGPRKAEFVKVLAQTKNELLNTKTFRLKRSISSER